MRLRRINTDKLKRTVDFSLVERFLNNLEFKITEDQKKAIEDCYNDIISPKPMNRLIQGDVGCGKSIVGYSAMLMEVASAFQVAVMLPTELLATEQFASIKKVFKNYSSRIQQKKNSNNNVLKEQNRRNIMDLLQHKKMMWYKIITSFSFLVQMVGFEPTN